MFYFRHVSSNDRLGKRYRETKPVFSIEDDDDEAGIKWGILRNIINLRTCEPNKVKFLVYVETGMQPRTGNGADRHLPLSVEKLFVSEIIAFFSS